MSSLFDTPSPTATPTPTKRPGEPSLGYRTATICALVLGGMVLLAVLVTLIAFRRALINKCIGRRYFPKTPPSSSSLPRSQFQHEHGGSGGGAGTGNARQMDEVKVGVGRRAMEARIEVSQYHQQSPRFSTSIVGGVATWSGTEAETELGPDSGFGAGGAGEGVGGGGVLGSGDIQNRRSLDSTTSSIQSTHTCASTIVVVPSTSTPSVTNIGTGIAENGMKRRSIWQDILQTFKTSRKHSSTDSIAAATTPIMTEPSSATVSRSASIVAVHHLPTTDSIAPSSPITSHQEAVIASTTSVYNQVFSITSPNSSTNLPPIIYCPRERAELDQLRQKYPTAAPGYTSYRLPPPPPPDREITVPLPTFTTTTATTATTIDTAAVPSRPRSRASTLGMSTSPTRVTFTDMSASSNTQRYKRTSAAATATSHSNRTSVISIFTPTPTTTPTSLQARQIPTSTSLPTFLTSPFLPHNRPTTPIPTPTPSQTPSPSSRKPKTLRALLPTIIDPTQSENHISNYFARNSRPYAPYSYPKIYAPSYGDVEDLPQISPILPSSPTLHDSGAGVGSGFGATTDFSTSNRNST